MSSQIIRSLNHYTHTTSPIYQAPAPWFWVVALFYSVPQPYHITSSYLYPRDNAPERGRTDWENAGPCKNCRVNLIIYRCTRDLHSFLSYAHCRAASQIAERIPPISHIYIRPPFPYNEHLITLILYRHSFSTFVFRILYQTHCI